jgi:uncharacterized PurR-regulated membrane protein YhhQ (DUF165 family)
MYRRRLTAAAAALGLLGSIYLANWLVENVGPIRVWPTTLHAPAGVYVVGLAFLLRDTIQRFAGTLPALATIAAGCGVAVLVSPRLALASAAAFACSELAGLAVFRLSRGNTAGPAGLTGAVVASSLVAAALDSYVFLTIAFGDLGFFSGQFVAKLSVAALALPFVLGARRLLPSEASA